MSGTLSRPSATSINALASRNARSVTVSGVNRLVPLVYGEVRMPGVYLTKPVIYDDGGGINLYLVFAIAWSHGECEGVQNVYINETSTSLGITLTHYTGTMSQTVDATLAAAIPGFADAFAGIAYTVFKIGDIAPIGGWPRIEAVFRGRKVYDPRTDITAWSQNAGLCIADFVQSTVYGPGLTITGTEAVADHCDSLYEGEARCEFNLALTEGETVESILDTMAAYAECLWSYDADGVLIVPDSIVEEPAAVLVKADIVDGSFEPSAQGALSAPTAVVVNYLPSTGSAAAWVPASARQTLVGVDDGDIDDIESALTFSGIRRLTEAARKARARLQRLQFPGRYRWQAFDSGVRFQRGDVVQLPNEWGLTNQLVRILAIDMVAYGLYEIEAEHYDSAGYSGDIAPDGDDGVVPVGLILPYIGSLPSGWDDFSDADGNYIVGAGGSLDVGNTGGTETHAGLSGNTSTSGAHTGADGTTYTVPETAAGGGGAAARSAAALSAGGHLHTFSTGTITPDLYRRHNRLMIKTGSEAVIVPGAALIFGLPNIVQDGLQRVLDYNSRYLVADADNQNAGSASVAITLNTGITNDNHYHTADEGENEAIVTFPPHDFITDTSGGGSHFHTFGANLSRNVKSRHLAVYGGPGGYPIRPGMIGMWSGAIESLPEDWYLCDGTGGTVDMRDRFVVFGGAELPAASGDNTISITGTTSQVGHSHGGSAYSNTSRTGIAGVPHRNEVLHSHTISASDAWTPPYYALAFIMYLPGA